MLVLGVGWGIRRPNWGCMGCWGYWGYIWKMKTVYCKVLVKTQDGLLLTIEYELRSMRPKLVPFLPTRCCYLQGIEGAYWGDGCGRIHLTKHHTDPQADHMLCWPAAVPLLTTRCLYWGLGVSIREANRVCRGIGGLHMKNEDCLLQSTCENSRWSVADNRTWAQVNGTQVHTTLGHRMPLPRGYVWLEVSLTQRLTKCQDYLTSYWAQVNWTYVSTILGHQMPLWEDTSDQMSRWPEVVLLLATRCLFWGYIWLNVSQTQRMTKCQHDLT